MYGSVYMYACMYACVCVCACMCRCDIPELYAVKTSSHPRVNKDRLRSQTQPYLKNRKAVAPIDRDRQTDRQIYRQRETDRQTNIHSKYIS